MDRLLTLFVVRWGVNSLGLWIASRLITGIQLEQDILTILWVGFLLSVANAIIKPIVLILSLPAIVLTLGIFMLFINGIMLAIVAGISSKLSIDSFWAATLGGIIVGFVNYLVTIIFDMRNS